MLKTTLKIYSPRWGHDDPYYIEMTRDYLKIHLLASPSELILRYRDNLDPEWEGFWGRNSLQKIMNNDMIYPPEIIPDLFQRVWLAWKDGELNDEEVIFELEQIAKWINHVTEGKPKTDFWKAYF